MSKKLTAARRNAFLRALAETGNQTISAEHAKVSRSWVCLHRKTDAEFDAACRGAIEVARAALQDAASHTSAPPLAPPLKGRGYFNGHELVVRGTGGSGGGKRVQVGRARLKQWTHRTERRFLAALSATCNVKAACAEVGMWPPSAYNHRHRRPGFAQAWDQAIVEGYARLEAALVEEACALFQPPDYEPPDYEPNGQIRGMTTTQAIHLLHMHKHKLFKLGKAPGLAPRTATPEEAERTMRQALGRLESWMKREAKCGNG